MKKVTIAQRDLLLNNPAESEHICLIKELLTQVSALIVLQAGIVTILDLERQLVCAQLATTVQEV